MWVVISRNYCQLFNQNSNSLVFFSIVFHFLIIFSSYALQFCVISVFHLLIWVSLRVFPLFIDSTQPGASNWFTFTSICQILSSLAVTVVYTFFNREVRHIFT